MRLITFHIYFSKEAEMLLVLFCEDEEHDSRLLL